MDNPNPPVVGKVVFDNPNPPVVGKVVFDKTCSCHSTNLGSDYAIHPQRDFVAKQDSTSPYEVMSASETLLHCKFRKAELEVTVNAAEDKVLAIYDNCGGEFTFDKKPITKALLEAIILIDDFFKP